MFSGGGRGPKFLVKGTEMVLLQSALDLFQLEEDPFRLQGGLLLPPPSSFLLFSTSSLFLFFGRSVVGGAAGGVTEDRGAPASASAIAGVAAAAFAGAEQLHSFCCNVANLMMLN